MKELDNEINSYFEVDYIEEEVGKLEVMVSIREEEVAVNGELKDFTSLGFMIYLEKANFMEDMD
jgi:hypothetical protein